MVSDWNHPVPIYVTRKDAEGLIGTVYVSAWFVFVATLLTMANVLGWGCFGIAELIGKLT